jgi:hypothetical protein
MTVVYLATYSVLLGRPPSGIRNLPVRRKNLYIAIDHHHYQHEHEQNALISSLHIYSNNSSEPCLGLSCLKSVGLSRDGWWNQGKMFGSYRSWI